MREFDEKSLAEFDGREGRPAYVAYQGRVFDVSASPRWKGGEHMRRHHAGTDLTAALSAAPHGVEKLEKFPQVGVLVPSHASTTLPPALESLLESFPTLRRHPHPMTVHFPIAFSFAVLFFSALGLLFGAASLETTALHCLGAGALFTPVAMVTGYASWKINYLGRPMRTVSWKIRLSVVLWALFVGGFVWAKSGAALLAVGLALASTAAAVGSLGASLTFPAERTGRRGD